MTLRQAVESLDDMGPVDGRKQVFVWLRLRVAACSNQMKSPVSALPSTSHFISQVKMKSVKSALSVHR